MNKTQNLNLGKPLVNEKYDVTVFNKNADLIDTAVKTLQDKTQNATLTNTGIVHLTDSIESEDTSSAATPNSVKKVNDKAEALKNSKVDKVNGKGLSTNDFNNDLKSNYDAAFQHSVSSHARIDATLTAPSSVNGNMKINGLETKVYTHPETHSASIITQDPTHRFVTDTEKAVYSDKYTKSEIDTEVTNLQNNIENETARAKSAEQSINDKISNVNNTSDINKPVSTAQQAAIDLAYQNSNAYTDQKIADLIGGASSTMDTLKEIEEAMESSSSVVSALEEAVGKKANQTELDGHISNEAIHVTTTDKDNWNDANDKKHVHENKSVLDGITSTLITSWNNAVKHISDTIKHITSDERNLWNTVSDKVDKVSGKGLSTNDLTDTLKNNYDLAYDHSQASHAPSNAQANVIETIKVNGTALTPSSKAVDITVPTKVSDFANDSGYITSDGTAKTISDILPISKGGTGTSNGTDAANTLINSLEIDTDTEIPTDTEYYISGKTTTYNRRPMSMLWNYIKSKLSTVATTGSYNDLSNTPTLGDGKITITQNGITKGSFTTNQSINATIELTDSNLEYDVVSTSANGLAPKLSGNTSTFLRGDGTYATIPTTSVPSANASTAGITKLYSSLGTATDGTVTQKVINDNIEALKKSVSDGKTLVANAITDKGVATATDASFDVMADNISQIETGTSGITEEEYVYEVAKRLHIKVKAGREKTSYNERQIGAQTILVYVDGSKISNITFSAIADRYTQNCRIYYSSEDYNESWEDDLIYFNTNLTQEFTMKTHTCYEEGIQHNESIFYISFNGSGSFFSIYPKSITMSSGNTYTFTSGQSYVDHFVEGIKFGSGLTGNYYYCSSLDGGGYRDAMKKMLCSMTFEGWTCGGYSTSTYKIPFHYANDVKSITYKIVVSKIVIEGLTIYSKTNECLWASDGDYIDTSTTKTITVDYSSYTEQYEILTISSIADDAPYQKYTITITDVQFRN